MAIVELPTQITPEETLHWQAIGPIADIHFTAYSTDGVGLQMQENEDELRRLGYSVSPCGADVPEAMMPGLDYHNTDAALLREQILNQEPNLADEPELIQKIRDQAEELTHQFLDFFDRNGITVAHVRNIMSLPYLHLPATMAIHNAIRQRPEMLFVLHHHDFNWEGPMAKRYTTKFAGIERIAEEYMLPNYDNTEHITINSIAAEELRRRRGINATVIPDGFNFDREPIPIDEAEFRRAIGVGDNDLVIGMMTRIRINKSIETAIQFARALMNQRDLLEQAPDGVGKHKRNFTKDSKIVLVIPQSKDMDVAYFEKMRQLAHIVGVDMRFIGDRVVPDKTYDNQPGLFPFYSTYGPMDMIIYPPTHEGWGNQADEAAWAKKPLIMRNYPVAEKDIWQHIPHLITLGTMQQTDRVGTHFTITKPGIMNQTVTQTIRLLQDHQLEEEWVEANYWAFRKLSDIRIITPQYLAIYQRGLDRIRTRNVH